MEGTPAEQLRKVEEEYRQKREALQQQMNEQAAVEQAPVPSEHETMSEVVEGAIKEHVPEFQASSHIPHHGDALAPEAQGKIQAWVNVAFTKGLSEGIKAAKDSNDVALIDAFHGALTGDLYDMLVESKKLELVK